MSDPEVTTREQWLVARRELLAREKELTRHRDEVNAARRALPMVEITKDYAFDGPGGRVGLLDLFEGRGQLVVYHVMYGPDDDGACPACSFWIDNVGHLSHLHARDTTFAAISRAPLEKLERYRRRMGWQVPWYSSYGSDFNYDFHVTLDASVTPIEYNFKDYDQLVAEEPRWRGWSGEEQGISAFLRRGDRVFHTYSCYSRGIDLLNGTYNWLDLTARGRQEDWEQPPGRGHDPFMGWLRRHDEYRPEELRGETAGRPVEARPSGHHCHGG
ncbi:DUF899 domain-containing protein [Saccharothrix australiensis]|uniref:Putative dithiol-disulfide oxidoreductase (DUF899 family) n=1 Tax=Saccharothrix australiensis TaxID=2072 RepID=A0A495W5V1_9PSEU|nr:DUF899 domain-containing protein [Saccharothrix australiensis]RKT55188.1 putative dithiol-disulfide oxidoreductase (DUF899 family) [Saccharothrix australiensis]